jgi:hypothetical protein
MACGAFVKPLRDLLFKLVDSQLPAALEKVHRMFPFTIFLLMPTTGCCAWPIIMDSGSIIVQYIATLVSPH